MDPLKLLPINKDIFKTLGGRRECQQAAQVNENTGNSNSTKKIQNSQITVIESELLFRKFLPFQPSYVSLNILCRV